MKKRRKLKRNVVIIMIALIVVILGVIGYILITDLKQEDILREEIKPLADKDLTKDNFNSGVKTKGDYAVVEEAIKDYLDEYAKTLQSISKISEAKELTNMLTASNYQNDGPDFVQSKAFIAKTREELNNSVNKLTEMSSPEAVKKNIEDKKLDEYYTELYTELMNNIIDTKFATATENIKATNEKLTTLLNGEEAVLNLLIQNKGKWDIQNDKIVFRETATISQYNELTKKLSS